MLSLGIIAVGRMKMSIYKDELRYNPDGETLDEVVMRNASVHLEQLNDHVFMLIVENKRYHTTGQDNLLDSDTRRMRDELIARLYTIRNPEAVAKALKINRDGE